MRSFAALTIASRASAVMSPRTMCRVLAMTPALYTRPSSESAADARAHRRAEQDAHLAGEELVREAQRHVAGVVDVALDLDLVALLEVQDAADSAVQLGR